MKYFLVNLPVSPLLFIPEIVRKEYPHIIMIKISGK